MFQAQFYLEQNEDCSLGDVISDSSEKLLQRSKGEISIYVIMEKKEFIKSST